MLLANSFVFGVHTEDIWVQNQKMHMRKKFRISDLNLWYVHLDTLNNIEHCTFCIR